MTALTCGTDEDENTVHIVCSGWLSWRPHPKSTHQMIKGWKAITGMLILYPLNLHFFWLDHYWYEVNPTACWHLCLGSMLFFSGWFSRVGQRLNNLSEHSVCDPQPSKLKAEDGSSHKEGKTTSNVYKCGRQQKVRGGFSCPLSRGEDQQPWSWL